MAQWIDYLPFFLFEIDFDIRTMFFISLFHFKFYGADHMENSVTKNYNLQFGTPLEDMRTIPKLG